MDFWMQIQYLYTSSFAYKWVKGKAIPLQALTGFQEFKAPSFLDTQNMKVVRSSPLRTGRLYPQEYPGTHFLEAQSTPGHTEMSAATE